MNALATTEPATNLPAVKQDDFGSAMQAMGAMDQFAKVMADSSMLPDCLTKKKVGKDDWEDLPTERAKANCFLVINQARIWDCDPFSLAGGISIVHGKVNYEGKIIAGVINARANLSRKLSYEFTGDESNPATLSVIVSGTIQGESAPRTVVMKWSEGSKRGGDAWKTQPEQQLCYAGARKWARRHAPSILMGISEDSAEREEAVNAQINGDSQYTALMADADYRKKLDRDVRISNLKALRDSIDSDTIFHGDHEQTRTSLLEFAEAKIEERQKEAYMEFMGRIEAIDFSDSRSVEILTKDIQTSYLPDDWKVKLREVLDRESKKATT